MKKISLLVLTLLLIIPMMIMAQGEPLPPVPVELTFEDYFASLSLLSGLVLVVFQFINDKLLKYRTNTTWTQILTWGLSVIFAFIGQWQGIGIFGELSLLWTLGYGLACGVLANKLFDVAVVQSILDFALLMLNKPKEE